MKRVSLSLLALFLMVGAHAQQQGGALLDAVLEESVKKEKDKSDKAIADEKNAVKPKIWMDRAKTYEQIATQVIKLDSNAVLVAYDAYKKVLEMDKDKNGEPGKLAKEAQEALKSQTMYAAFMSAGASKYQSKKFGEATKLMAMAGAINAKDTTAALYTGISAQQANDQSVAKEWFEKYIVNGGKDATVFYTLATLYRNDKDIDKALATIDKGIAVLPSNKDLSSERINILLASGRSEEAMVGMKQLVEKDPNNVNHVLNLGIMYDNIAQKADDELKKLEGGVRKKNDLNKQLAEEKVALQTMQSELIRLTDRAKKDPKNAEVKRQLVNVSQMVSQSKTKIVKLEEDAKAESQQAQSVSMTEQRVSDLTKQYEENKGSAKLYYEKALQIDGTNYDANFNMGVLYFNEGVRMKQQVDRMDMKEYQAKGKEVEGQVCSKFKRALPYFTKAKTIKDTDDMLNDNLINLQNILKQFEEKKIICVEPSK